MSALTVVEDLQVLEERGGQLEAGGPGPPVQELDLHALQNDSIKALSKHVPTAPIEGSKPTA